MKLNSILVISSIVFLVGLFVGGVSAQKPTRWVNEFCYTNGCIGDMLNKLTPEQAHEAKITTWRDVSYVWYRK